jgi:tetratricopeptide (TPR) repeat protein
MQSHLIDLDRKALELKKSGRLAEAAEAYATIVKERPDWEHGTAYFNLAGCYEDMDDSSLAEISYRKALVYDPNNPYFLGGLASLLYLHGDAKEAFSSYQTLFEIEKSNGNVRGMEIAKSALRTLGLKLGIPENTLEAQFGAPEN